MKLTNLNATGVRPKYVGKLVLLTPELAERLKSYTETKEANGFIRLGAELLWFLTEGSEMKNLVNTLRDSCLGDSYQGLEDLVTLTFRLGSLCDALMAEAAAIGEEEQQ